jgi:hypothetical protein
MNNCKRHPKPVALHVHYADGVIRTHNHFTAKAAAREAERLIAVDAIRRVDLVLRERQANVKLWETWRN